MADCFLEADLMSPSSVKKFTLYRERIYIIVFFRKKKERRRKKKCDRVGEWEEESKPVV
jgi:hypothetical protein